MYISQQDLVSKAGLLHHENFEIDVVQPNSFTSKIQLHYQPPWPGEQHEDVRDVKSTYTIQFSHEWQEFMIFVPTIAEPRVKTPEMPYDFHARDGAITYRSYRDVVVELRSGIEYDVGLFEWLADYIERERIERLGAEAYGVGKSKMQTLYDRFGTIGEIMNASHDELAETINHDRGINTMRGMPTETT